MTGNQNTHKGFGFVEYELPEDCQAAIDNMHLAELNGKVIKVQLAKPHNITATSHRAGIEKDKHISLSISNQLNPL